MRSFVCIDTQLKKMVPAFSKKINILYKKPFSQLNEKTACILYEQSSFLNSFEQCIYFFLSLSLSDDRISPKLLTHHKYHW